LRLPTCLAARRCSLVFRAEQVEDSLDRIEGQAGDFDKYRVPVCHGTVPQPGEFQSLEVSAIMGFPRDKASIGIDKTPQLERLSTVVPYATYQIDGVKMGCSGKAGALRSGVHIHLRRFDNLHGQRPVGLLYPEWPATGLASVFDHTADA